MRGWPPAEHPHGCGSYQSSRSTRVREDARRSHPRIGLSARGACAPQKDTPPAAPTTTYRIAPGKGQSVRWEARTNVESYAGNTDDVEGELRIRPDKPAEGAYARFFVRPASFRTGNASRDSKMRRQHLDTERYPTAIFTLTGLKTAHTGPLPYDTAVAGTVEGTLELRGVSRPVAAASTVTRGRDEKGRDTLRIVARFTVRLGDHKIPTPRFLFLTVKQEHPVTVDVRAVAAP